MAALERIQDHGLLRFLTCGSVDDGKSTLIGRLLFDTRTILTDTLAQIERTSQRRGLSAVDLSLLTDGLSAEREQGITIDVAYRYFSTGTRKYIIADAPGHEQYTRNMVTAASTADLAILLVDARKGLSVQTRRHAAVCHLLGIRHLVVAVNKMDLVEYDQAVFERIRADFQDFAAGLGLSDTTHDVTFVPMSALNGDMVVDRGEALAWYEGPTLLELLETAPGAHGDAAAKAEQFRFPIQWVCRPQASDDPELHDYRGFCGRIESGTVQVGDRILALPAWIETKVKAIHIGGQPLTSAVADQSVTLLLEDEIDLSRGDMLVKAGSNGSTASAANGDGAVPEVTKQLDAMVCWFAETPLDRSRKYTIRHTTRSTRAAVGEIAYKLDVNTLEQQGAEKLAMNDIARVSFRLAQPVFCDSYAKNRATGAFVIIDEATFDTVGAGMVV
ncbi:GTP-binding protein [Oryzomicrobium sp.]|uniref:sulfate adenylyltransferase subunit 1 n=1 Tax=Oryzomicrobium sp. TaxID=1911578 RepID=UPI0025DEA72F|nr:GTP-binding protein [Oryzomicrobium sp.]MCE1242487.1 GTP-binding protein [Oryzomicrobium sp.]